MKTYDKEESDNENGKKSKDKIEKGRVDRNKVGRRKEKGVCRRRIRLKQRKKV